MQTPEVKCCPIPGCEGVRRAGQVLCKRHWYQVPEELRAEIWRLYHAEPGSPAHRAAIAQAVAHVLRGGTQER